MKTKLTQLIIFASAGAIFHSGPMALADGQSRAGFNEPAGAELRAGAQLELDQAEFGELKRASELIGTDVRNQQDERLGDIRDLMVDMESGRVPFVVLSSGGFFGIGGQLVAVPPSKFADSSQDNLVLSLDRQQLDAAPKFDRNNWPDMSDPAWSSEAYSFYGETPYWQSDIASVEIREPAGAQPSTRIYDYDSPVYQSEAYKETETGLSKDRKPRQGLGAEDLTRNEQSIRHPGGYAESDVFIQESAGAERTRTTVTTKSMHLGKVKRASELIGMEVKDAQNQHIGEIQDIVVDLQSGRVAYAVLDAEGYVDDRGKFHAVPTTVLSRSADERTLVLKTDKAKLQTAPSFNKNNWPEATNQQFTREVYSYYGQQPYWQQQGRQIQEPSGSKQDMKMHKRHDSRDSSGEWQRGSLNQQYEYDQRSQIIQEPSGAAPSYQAPGAQIQQPAGAEPERQYSSPQEQQQSSATRETYEVETFESQTEVQEPAGATPGERVTATQQQGQTTFDQQLSQRLRAALQTDPALSSEAKNVQVRTSNGKITLHGTVSSEQEKQSIADKVQEVVIDNRLQVKGESNP